MALVDSILAHTEDVYIAALLAAYSTDVDIDPHHIRIAFAGRTEGAPAIEAYESFSPGIFIEYLYGDNMGGATGIRVDQGTERFNVYGILRQFKEDVGLERTEKLSVFQALTRKWADKFLRRMIEVGDGLRPSAFDEFGWKTGIVVPKLWGIAAVGFSDSFLDYLCYVQFSMNIEK
jgi:hypothetical protein